MPRVASESGETVIEIEDDLLRDFFEEVFVYDKDLFTVLAEYNTETRYDISQYIIYRLAMVDSDYMPESGYDRFGNSTEV